MDTILSRKIVLEIFGRSNATLHRDIKRGIFPKPVPLGNGISVGWLRSEVEAYLEARKAARAKTQTSPAPAA